MAAKKIEFNQNQMNADIALKNRLYVSGYMLSHLLKDIRLGNIAANVALHYEEDIPVGVAVHIIEEDYNDYQVMVFVRKSKRCKGIGSKLLKELDAPKTSIIGTGCSVSSRFWYKNGFRNYDNYFQINLK